MAKIVEMCVDHDETADQKEEVDTSKSKGWDFERVSGVANEHVEDVMEHYASGGDCPQCLHCK